MTAQVGRSPRGATARRRTARHGAELSGAATRRRVVLLAARSEAVRMCRSPLLSAGTAVAAGLIWWNSRDTVPQWWLWDVQIGSSLLAVAGAVLLAAHLAAGRVRRDGAAHLYRSYPTAAPARTAAHLLSVVGPLLVSLVLVGAAVAWLQAHGAVGAPRAQVLGQGLLLVTLAGALGVALGTWLPGPMAGILALVVLGAVEVALVRPISAPVRMPGGTVWLFPWTQPAELRWLPGPTAMLPPASHLVWLAALTVAAALVAAARYLRARRPARVTLAAAVALVCVVAAGWSGWQQTRYPSDRTLTALVDEATRPARNQRCETRERVQYCAYPGYESNVDRWATVVDGVLSLTPQVPVRTLVVRQVTLVDPLFGLGFSYRPTTRRQRATLARLQEQVNDYMIRLPRDPGLVPGSGTPPVYVGTGWGGGSAAGTDEIHLALNTAWWVVGLPTVGAGDPMTQAWGAPGAGHSCLAVHQAREAVALWLATVAAPHGQTYLQDALSNPRIVQYQGAPVEAYYSPLAQYSQATIGFTRQGFALAAAMRGLTRQRVEAALAARWSYWRGPRATMPELAAALGIQLPPVPAPGRAPAPGGIVAPGTGGVAVTTEPEVVACR